MDNPFPLKKNILSEAVSQTLPQAQIAPAPLGAPSQSLDDHDTKMSRIFYALTEAISLVYQQECKEAGIRHSGFDAEFGEKDAGIYIIFKLCDMIDGKSAGNLDRPGNNLFKAMLEKLAAHTGDETSFVEGEIPGLYMIQAPTPWPLIAMLRNYLEEAELLCLDDAAEMRSYLISDDADAGDLSHLPMQSYFSRAAAKITGESCKDTIVPLSLKHMEVLTLDAQRRPGEEFHVAQDLRPYLIH